MLTRLVLALLNRKSLSVVDRNALLSGIIDKLGATPIKDIITYDLEGKMLLNGREVDLEQARILRESARGALNNQALRIIRESVTYQAFSIAATKAEKDEDLLFGKSAIWFGQQELKMLDILAGNDEVVL